MEERKEPVKGVTIMLPESLWTQLKQRALDQRTTTKQIVVAMLKKEFKDGRR